MARMWLKIWLSALFASAVDRTFVPTLVCLVMPFVVVPPYQAAWAAATLWLAWLAWGAIAKEKKPPSSLNGFEMAGSVISPGHLL